MANDAPDFDTIASLKLLVPVMAIADTPDSFDRIRDFGFEVALDQLIAYAEMQSRLHQSLGDREQ